MLIYHEASCLEQLKNITAYQKYIKSILFSDQPDVIFSELTVNEGSNIKVECQISGNDDLKWKLPRSKQLL